MQSRQSLLPLELIGSLARHTTAIAAWQPMTLMQLRSSLCHQVSAACSTHCCHACTHCLYQASEALCLYAIMLIAIILSGYSICLLSQFNVSMLPLVINPAILP